MSTEVTKIRGSVGLTLVGEGEVSEVPDAHVRPVKDLVLLVVADHVALDQVVVDGGGLHSFNFLLDLALRLQAVFNVLLHTWRLVFLFLFLHYFF